MDSQLLYTVSKIIPGTEWDMVSHGHRVNGKVLLYQH